MNEQETKTCQNCKSEFIINASDFAFYAKMEAPPPTFCPECRLQRRFAFRNERSLYKGTCGLCKGSIISMYSPDKSFTVYCPSCFHSDKWDPLDFSRAYDFSRPFFEQWKELLGAVPHIALFQENTVQSPWVNYELDAKNCYLNFGGHLNEDCAYNQYAIQSRDAFDNFWLMKSEFAYESILSEQCYKTFFSTLCVECRDTYFSLDCRNCSNIFGCVGLRNKEHYLFNKPVGKEAFETFLRDNDLSSHGTLEQLKNRVREFYRQTPQRAVFIDSKSVECSGNLITASKDCIDCWNTEKSEHLKYALFALESRDCMDTTSLWRGEQLYEMLAGVELFNVRFSWVILSGSRNVEYSTLLFNCTDCFGCASMKKKQYCILNKQYGKDEYHGLTARIREQMQETPYTDNAGRMYHYGEFFPYELSLYDYNETSAFDYFPLSKEEVLAKGWRWKDKENTRYQIIKRADELPDDIKDADDSIAKEIVGCASCGLAFRIVPQELTLLRRFHLPLPRTCFECRQRVRISRMNPVKSSMRTCAKCGKEISTNYPPDRPERIYCETCFNNEVA